MRRTLPLILAVLALFALGFLYVGSTHRDRCLKAHNAGCTILPWSGHPHVSMFGTHGWWNSP